MSRKYGRGGGPEPGQMLTFEKREAKRKAEKEKKLMSDISGFIKTEKKQPEKKRLEDVPRDFIQAVLERFYQKYARDKLPRIPTILDKYEGQYHKLEAGLRKSYKDKAPDIQRLYDDWRESQKEELDILEEAAAWDGLTNQELCIQIEKKRRKLDISKCTPVTPETFRAWREKKMQEDSKIKEAKEKEAKSKGGAKVTGRALYQLDATLFEDDDDAAGQDEIQIQEDPDYSDEEGGAADQGGAQQAAGASAAVVDESLFVDDDDLPDTDDES